MNTYSSATGLGSANWLTSAVKNNPEGLLLLAAGCALLLRTTRGAASNGHRADQYQRYASGAEQRHSGSGRGWGMPEEVSRVADTARESVSRATDTARDGVSRAAETAREYASDVGITVTEAADRYVSAAGEYANEARRTIADQSARIAEQAQSGIERIFREQPLAVAIAGVAVGAIVAAAFPTSQIERENLGPAGKRLSDAASSAGERLSEAASAAGERLMNVADKKGLSTEGLKEVARDVAGTFENTLVGGHDRASCKQNTSPASGSTAQSGAETISTATSGRPAQSSSSIYGGESRSSSGTVPTDKKR